MSAMKATPAGILTTLIDAMKATPAFLKVWRCARNSRKKQPQGQQGRNGHVQAPCARDLCKVVIFFYS